MSHESWAMTHGHGALPVPPARWQLAAAAFGVVCCRLPSCATRTWCGWYVSSLQGGEAGWDGQQPVVNRPVCAVVVVRLIIRGEVLSLCA